MRVVVKQERPRECGHACIATIVGRSLIEVRAEAETAGRMTAPQVRRALHGFSYEMDHGVRVRQHENEPAADGVTGVWGEGLMIARVRYKAPDKGGHWVVVENRRVLDPGPRAWADAQGRVTTIYRVRHAHEAESA